MYDKLLTIDQLKLASEKKPPSGFAPHQGMALYLKSAAAIFENQIKTMSKTTSKDWLMTYVYCCKVGPTLLGVLISPIIANNFG